MRVGVRGEGEGEGGSEGAGCRVRMKVTLHSKQRKKVLPPRPFFTGYGEGEC